MKLEDLFLVIAATAITAILYITTATGSSTTSYHYNTHKHSAWHFPKKMEKLQRYRTIARHDKWVIRTRHSHPVWLNNLHRRELKHANAHIKKLTPVPFSYPWWWYPLGVCETGSDPPDPAYNGSDGYDGWINFLPSTWDTYKRYVPGASQYAYAYQAPEYVQYLVTMAMHNSGVPWSQSNPACSAQIGLS